MTTKVPDKPFLIWIVFSVEKYWSKINLLFHLVHKGIFQEKNVKAKMNFIENLPFSSLERVFSIKALPYFFFPYSGCLQDVKGRKYSGEVRCIVLCFVR
jgi:hypothetical protein